MAAQNAAPGPAPEVPAWHTLTREEVSRSLETDWQSGLSADVAAARLAAHGPNAMTPPPKKSFMRRLWDQVGNVLMGVLVAAAVVSGVFKDWAELGLIVGVIVINVIIGLVQEGKAEKAADAIKNLLAPAATVIRNGTRTKLDARNLMPGDLVFLEAGDRVPADIRVVSASNLRASESILTGESVPRNKVVERSSANSLLADRSCMLYSGTLVVYGQGQGIVVSTGDATEIGKIGRLVSETAGGKTPLLVQLDRFGTQISIATLTVAIVTLLIAHYARGIKLETSFLVAIGVAVAIIPEGLPSVVTVTLALGVEQMASKNAIIRQLPAVETLGALTVICSDKTGTLTKNEMSAVALRTSDQAYRVTGTGWAPEGDIKHDDEPVHGVAREQLRRLLLPGVLCNDATLAAKRRQRRGRRGTAGNDSALAADATDKARVGDTPAVGASDVKIDMDPPVDVDGSIAVQRRMTMHYHATEARGDIEWSLTGDPTEGALLTLGYKAGITSINTLRAQYPRLATLPFESEYKFMGTLHNIQLPDGTTRRFAFVKGAPDRLIPRCATQAAGTDPYTSMPIDREMWTVRASELSREGLRVLALCQMQVPSDKITLSTADILEGDAPLQLNCLVAIVDPPRDDCGPAIEQCHSAGITVKMITGDHPQTAATIGRELGIETDEVLTGQQLTAMSDDELCNHVEGCNIFARASPEDKLRIVRALQTRGHVVSMTGDGVNDAPSLRQANVGVAMGIAGTDVAKEAAKMILADDAFSTIVVAVRVGRAVYDNLRKTLLFVLPTNVAQGLSIFFAIVIGQEYPLSPIQVLWVNMATSVTLGAVLALEAPEQSIMNRPPRRVTKGLVGKLIIWRCIFVGGILIVAMLGNMAWEGVRGGTIGMQRAVAMNTLVIGQCFYVINCRFIQRSSFSLSAWYGNPWVVAMIVLNVAAQCFLTYTPGVQEVFSTGNMDGAAWGRCLMFGAVVYILVELEKRFGPVYIRPVVMPIIQWMRRWSRCGASRPAAAPGTGAPSLGISAGTSSAPASDGAGAPPIPVGQDPLPATA